MPPPQECKALHFQATVVEMPNTDALPYLMYKSIRETLKELHLHLDKTLDRDLSRISDKGASQQLRSARAVLQRKVS